MSTGPADDYIEACAQVYDACIFPGLGDCVRDVWRDIKAWILPAPCDCPMDPYHRWNCPLTPLWAQTMRDLDVNPWTVINPRMTIFPGGFGEFVWDGSRDGHCGRGPCCLGDNHDGRCQM